MMFAISTLARVTSEGYERGGVVGAAGPGVGEMTGTRRCQHARANPARRAWPCAEPFANLA